MSTILSSCTSPRSCTSCHLVYGVTESLDQIHASSKTRFLVIPSFYGNVRGASNRHSAIIPVISTARIACSVRKVHLVQQIMMSTKRGTNRRCKSSDQVRQMLLVLLYADPFLRVGRYELLLRGLSNLQSFAWNRS